MILSFNKSFDIISILGHNHPAAVNKSIYSVFNQTTKGIVMKWRPINNYTFKQIGVEIM